MRNSPTFQVNKHELGKSRYDKDDVFKIKIPDLREIISDDTLSVNRGEMVFRWYVRLSAKSVFVETRSHTGYRGELESLFEDQVRKIKIRINEVLDDLALGGRQRDMPPGKPVVSLLPPNAAS